MQVEGLPRGTFTHSTFAAQPSSADPELELRGMADGGLLPQLLDALLPPGWRLSSLMLMDCEVQPTLPCHRLSALTSLRMLCCAWDELVCSVPRLACQAPDLRCLRISYLESELEDDWVDLTPITGLTRLTHLELHALQLLDIPAGPYLAGKFCGLEAWVSCHAGEARVVPRSSHECATSLCRKASACCTLPHNAMLCIARLPIAGLRRLALSQNEFALLPRALAGATSLTYLDLRESFGTALSEEDVSQVLSHMRQLSRLVLGYRKGMGDMSGRVPPQQPHVLERLMRELPGLRIAVEPEDASGSDS